MKKRYVIPVAVVVTVCCVIVMSTMSNANASGSSNADTSAIINEGTVQNSDIDKVVETPKNAQKCDAKCKVQNLLNEKIPAEMYLNATKDIVAYSANPRVETTVDGRNVGYEADTVYDWYLYNGKTGKIVKLSGKVLGWIDVNNVVIGDNPTDEEGSGAKYNAVSGKTTSMNASEFESFLSSFNQ